MGQLKKFTGFISCGTAIIALGALLIVFFTDEVYDNDGDEILLWLLAVIIATCAIHYTFATKFWQTTRLSPIESLNRENEIIRKQIERKELLLKLESMEKTS